MTDDYDTNMRWVNKMDENWNIQWISSLLVPLTGVFVGWGLFVHGSFIASIPVIMLSVIVFGVSLLLFVAMGNFVETRSFIVKQIKSRHRKEVIFETYNNEQRAILEEPEEYPVPIRHTVL